jgi:hypothetical protein
MHPGMQNLLLTVHFVLASKLQALAWFPPLQTFLGVTPFLKFVFQSQQIAW